MPYAHPSTRAVNQFQKGNPVNEADHNGGFQNPNVASYGWNGPNGPDLLSVFESYGGNGPNSPYVHPSIITQALSKLQKGNQFSNLSKQNKP